MVRRSGNEKTPRTREPGVESWIADLIGPKVSEISKTP